MPETEDGREAKIEKAKEQANQALADLSIEERKELLESLLQETEKQEIEQVEDETEVIEAYFEKQGAGVCTAEVIQQLRSEAEFGEIPSGSLEQGKKRILKRLPNNGEKSFDPDIPNVDHQITERQYVRSKLEPFLHPEKHLIEDPSPFQNTLRNGLLPIITEQIFFGNLNHTFWAQSQGADGNIKYNADLLLFELGDEFGIKAKKPVRQTRDSYRWFDSGHTENGAALIKDVQDSSHIAERFNRVHSNFALPYIKESMWRFQIMRILGTHPALEELFPDSDIKKLDESLEKHGVRVVNGFYQREPIMGEKDERQAKVDLIEAQALAEQLQPLINKLDAIQSDEKRYKSKLKVEATGERLSEFNALALEFEKASKELDKLNQDYLEIVAALKETGLFGRMKMRGEERKQADSALEKIQKDMDQIKEKYEFDKLKKQILQYQDLFSRVRSDQDMIDLAADWSANKALMQDLGEMKKGVAA